MKYAAFSLMKTLQILRNNTFRIYQVNTADEGLYYCNVTNKYGINRATNRLHVFSKFFCFVYVEETISSESTYFTRVPSPKKLTVEAGQRVEVRQNDPTPIPLLFIPYFLQMECEAVQDDRLSISYTWTVDGREIDMNDGAFEYVYPQLGSQKR